MIGVGSAGSGFVKVFGDEERVELRAICDVDASRLAEVQQSCGVPMACSGFEEIADRSDIEVVAVCTPDHLHTDASIAMMEAGKHVIVEKPLATTFAELERTVETARRTGRKVAHGTQLRYMAAHREIKRRVDAGELGEIYYVEADYGGHSASLFVDAWRGDPGIDYNAVAGGGVHILDLLLWFMGDEVTEVASYGNLKCITDTGLDTFDCVVSILRFQNGCVGKTTTSFGTDRPTQGRGIELCGTEGCLVSGPEPKIGRGASEPEFEPITGEDVINLRSQLLSDLLDSIESDEQPLTNIDEAARTAAVCIAAYESAKSGAPVRVPRF